MRIPTGYPPPPHMAYPGPYGYHPVYYGYTPYLPYAVSFVHCVYLKENLIASAEYSFISKYCDVAKECLPLKEYPPPTFDPISYGGSKFKIQFNSKKKICSNECPPWHELRMAYGVQSWSYYKAALCRWM